MATVGVKGLTENLKFSNLATESLLPAASRHTK